MIPGCKRKGILTINLMQVGMFGLNMAHARRPYSERSGKRMGDILLEFAAFVSLKLYVLGTRGCLREFGTNHSAIRHS